MRYLDTNFLRMLRSAKMSIMYSHGEWESMRSVHKDSISFLFEIIEDVLTDQADFQITNIEKDECYQGDTITFKCLYDSQYRGFIMMCRDPKYREISIWFHKGFNNNTVTDILNLKFWDYPQVQRVCFEKKDHNHNTILAFVYLNGKPDLLEQWKE